MLAPEKMAQLEQFLGLLEGSNATKLASAIEMDRLAGSDALPHEAIMESLRPALRQLGGDRVGVPTPLRLLCVPFEDMLINGEHAKQKRRGRISRAVLQPMWEWLESDVLGEELRRLANKITGALLSGKNAEVTDLVADMHEAAAVGIRETFEKIDPDSKEYRQIALRLGSLNHVEDVREIGHVLEVAEHILDIQDRLPKQIPSFTEDLREAVQKVFNFFAANLPDHAPYVALVVMGRLEKPWEILRILRTASKSADDTVIARTDVSVVGELLLADLEDCAVYFTKLKRSEPPENILFWAKRFQGLSTGITHELGIRKDGDWGTRVINARRTVAAGLGQVLEAAPREIFTALPVKTRVAVSSQVPLIPNLATTVAPETAKRAVEVARLVDGCRSSVAEAASVGSTLMKAREELSKMLHRYSDHLVECARSAKPSETDALHNQLEICADIVTVLLGEEETKMLRRRFDVAFGQRKAS